MTDKTTDNTTPVHAAFAAMTDGARFYNKMMGALLEESDKQVGENMKAMATWMDHARASRNQAMKLWTEGVERSLAMGEEAARGVTTTWSMK